MSRKLLTWLVAVLSLVAATGAVARAAGSPDLVATMSAPTKLTGPGNPGFSRIGIVNYGGAAAPRSKGKLLLSKDSRPDSGDRVLTLFSVRALPSRGSVIESATYTVPAAYGSWYLIACADVTHAVHESNETNNCAVSPWKMVIGHNPPMPVLTSVTPASPSKLPPTVHGTGPAGDYILLYTNPTCSGQYVSGNKIGSNGTWVAGLNLISDGTFIVHARTDWTTGKSACSTTFVTFTRDTTAPPTPTNLAITGGGTGSDITPMITGTTEPGATVHVFSDQDLSPGACQTALGSTVAGIDGHFSWDEPIPLSSPNDTYRTYHLRADDAAGNQTTCTAQLDYLLN